ncbi:Protein of unknown function [Micromonospora echinaurantiaca]|uniref:Uncharacterized protein n=1 Tax=Micromonospora echinaurantiaca TaxID=47857 RepID=A0A1C5IK48_9ACTN|nr:DUF3375 family protein [Micromonospora echinaurantiaca]SCG58186.1 Protein of unknown function [Micromonospora echinaurantiaca]
MGITGERIRAALDSNPTLTLLKAYSRDWVLPLFAEHLDQIDGSVSAEWFHERVSEAREQVPDWQGSVTPAEHCRDWVEKRWLETETLNGRLRYRLSPYSLRALRFVRELVEGETTVSGARLGSITHAVRLLADMTNPDRDVQVRRIDQQIAELRKRRQDIASGRVRLATLEEMKQQLREILAMTRSLPADFRQLRTMVEDRHQEVARRAMVQGPRKADLVEDYLRENDLLSKTSQGTAYLGFSRLLSSRQTEQLRADIDQILAQEFAREHVTAAQREELDGMLSTLLAAELDVQSSYVRWSASLRRFLTRVAHGRHQRLLSLADRALHAGGTWVQAEPGQRYVPQDVLGVGPLAITDISQTQLWRDHGPQEVVVEVTEQRTTLPTADRAALRLAAGTSPRAVGRTINRLLASRPVVTGAEVFDATAPEFQRLGTLVSLLDLAVMHGQVDINLAETVRLSGDRAAALMATLPALVFDAPVPTKEVP